MRKFLLLILLVVSIIFAVFRSPIFGNYYYNQAKKLYDSGKYEASVPVFEKSLSINPNKVLSRYYYVNALSKSKPIYSVQKKLYYIANNSKLDDDTVKFAKYQTVSLRKQLLKGLEDNYIDNAVNGSDILRWDINSFPLKIYYVNPDSVPQYYISNIQKALQQWTQRTTFVKFVQTNDLNSANIVIRFDDIKTDCPASGCKYTVALTKPDISKDGILKKSEIIFYKTNPRKDNFSEKEIYNTALHELGHALGIAGHSDSNEDLMYVSAQNNVDTYASPRSDFYYLSKRDINTLVLLYRLKPSISNIKNLKSETFYYPPLVLGNTDERLKKKLVEYKKYIDDYPNFPSGYINLSSLYTDMNDFDSALSMLDKAEKLNPSQDELYIINYNRAVIYYNKHDFDKSKEFALKAKSIKSDKNINDFITDIEKAKQNL